MWPFVVTVVGVVGLSPIWMPLLFGALDRLDDHMDARLLRFMDRLYEWARGD